MNVSNKFTNKTIAIALLSVVLLFAVLVFMLYFSSKDSEIIEDNKPVNTSVDVDIPELK